jgi:hypothetical protein
MLASRDIPDLGFDDPPYEAPVGQSVDLAAPEP